MPEPREKQSTKLVIETKPRMHVISATNHSSPSHNL